jgi:hypothetical protein
MHVDTPGSCDGLGRTLTAGLFQANRIECGGGPTVGYCHVCCTQEARTIRLR